MALNPNPTYPTSGCYVLKLHRDSEPRSGLVSGLLEHVSSGECIDFDSAPALLSALLAHAATKPDPPDQSVTERK